MCENKQPKYIKHNGHIKHNKHNKRSQNKGEQESYPRITSIFPKKIARRFRETVISNEIVMYVRKNSA